MDSEDRSTQKDTSSSAVTSSLSDLIARLEKATGPDRELDCAIAIAIKGGRIEWILDGNTKEQYPVRVYICQSRVTNELQANVPFFTSSIDAAMTLVPTTAEAWLLGSGIPTLVKLTGYAAAKPWASIDRGPNCPGDTPAIALCIAALKARSLPAI